MFLVIHYHKKTIQKSPENNYSSAVHENWLNDKTLIVSFSITLLPFKCPDVYFYKQSRHGH